MQVKLSNQGFMLVLLPLAMQVTFMIIFMGMLHQAERDIATERHSREIVSSLNRIARLLLASVAGQALQLGPTSSSSKPTPRGTADGIPLEFARLKELVADPEQVKTIHSLESAWQENVACMEEVKRLANAGEPMEALKNYGRFKSSFHKVYDSLETAAKYFQDLEDQSPKIQAENRNRQKTALIVFLFLDVVMAVFLCMYFKNRTASRLTTLMDNARNLAMERPIERPLGGNDEITELQKTFIAVAHSLSAARRKERAILNNAGDVICTIDGHLVIASASPATRKVWGYSEEDLLGKRLAEMIDSSDWGETQKHLADIRQTQSQRDIENKVRTAYGNTIDMIWNVNWSQEEQSYFCVVHDISERRQLEKLKRDFMSMITHDIRSPINSVLGFLTLLEESVYGQLNERGMKKLRATEQSISLAVRLISDLLTLEKDDSGMLTLEVKNTKSFALMERTQNVVKALAEAKGITVQLTGSDLPLCADEDRLVQVLVNLLGNAIKFSPKDATITFASEQQPGRVIFSVKDQGPGIKPENLSAVFDRYKQLSAEDATVRGGTGLGLAIAKAIVEKHNGEIYAESDGKNGSRFVVDLPDTLELTATMADSTA